MRWLLLGPQGVGKSTLLLSAIVSSYGEFHLSNGVASPDIPMRAFARMDYRYAHYFDADLVEFDFSEDLSPQAKSLILASPSMVGLCYCDLSTLEYLRDTMLPIVQAFYSEHACRRPHLFLVRLKDDVDLEEREETNLIEVRGSLMHNVDVEGEKQSRSEEEGVNPSPFVASLSCSVNDPDRIRQIIVAFGEQTFPPESPAIPDALRVRYVEHHTGQPCFTGSNLVELASGNVIRVDRLRKGDVVRSSASSTAIVECVICTRCRYGKTDLVVIPNGNGKGTDLQITPWHPIRSDTVREWCFPALVAPIQFNCPCELVYNVVLAQNECGGSLWLNGYEVASFGHGLKDDAVVSHSYFGSYGAVVRDLMGIDLQGWQAGWIDLNDGVLKRDPLNGVVTGLVREPFSRV